jgi:di/tricarboxylate transporter
VSFSILVVLLLLVLAVANFVFEWVQVELFSVLLIVALVAFRVLEPEDAFRGFGNSAIVMIAGVMVLTGAVLHNGAADILARRIERAAGESERRLAALLYAAVNAVSAFINNVAATAMFIPVGEALARRFRVGRGRYLLPIAFASMTGGMCTLIGTSTNVAVSGAMLRHGLAPLGFFELAPVGVVLAAVGILFHLWITPRVLKPLPEQAPVEAFGLKEFLYEVLVQEGSPFAGRTLSESGIGALGINVLALVRGPERLVSPPASEVVRAGDLLLVEGERRTILEVAAADGLAVKSMPPRAGTELDRDQGRLLEVTISYNSPFIGKTLQELGFRKRYDLSVLALHRSGEPVVEKVGKIRLRAGDVLLVYGREPMFDRLEQEPNMLLIEGRVLPRLDPVRATGAVAVLAGTILASSAGLVDAPTAFLAGAVLVIALKILPTEQAASYVNLRFLIMLAGMMTLGAGMEKSGAAEWLATGLLALLRPDSALAALAVLFGITVVLTQPLNNAGAAVLVLPVAIHTASSVGGDPRAFAIGVTIAASCSFITPFEPACMLVYSTGRYRFGDFVRVGSLLTAVAFLASLTLIPLLWPLRAGG